MQNVIKYIVLVFLFTQSLYAEENKLTTSIAYVGMSMDYREYDRAGNILDSEKSSFTDLTGVELGMNYRLSSSGKKTTQLEMTLVVLGGYTEYVGSLLNSNDGYGSYVGTTADAIIDIDIIYNRLYQLNNKLEINYGLGLGYRFWERALSVTQIEDYIWYSLRAKLGAEYRLSKAFKVGGLLEYQHGFNTTMYEHSLNTTFTLGGANIIKVSIPLVYEYSKEIDFFLEGVYEEQYIQASNVVGGFYEPDSTAKNQYIKVGANFKF